MNKCLRITFQGDFPEGFFRGFVQKYAKSLSLEGTFQRINNDGKTVRIIACGAKDAVDEFLDLIYKKTSSLSFDDIEIEPFFKEKDYRGVFRIIE